MDHDAAGVMNPQTILYVAYGIMALSVVAFLAFGIRRMRKPRRLKLERLWVIPAIYGLFAVGLFWRQPPHGVQWLWAAAALVAGAGFGWLRGRAMRIEVDPVTHDLNQRQSPAAFAVIILLVIARTFARERFGGGDLTHAAPAVVDAFVAFAVGLLSTQRLEMYLRARRLLGRARDRLRQDFA